jgi:D-alanine-D-alanine ligase
VEIDHSEKGRPQRKGLAAQKVKVAILTGGIGEERDVSIQSGACVEEALEKAGIDVAVYDVAPGSLGMLEEKDIDVFFLALHGAFGEDGQLQQILEDKRLTYTGSGPKASRLAFDKMAGRKAFAACGLKVAPAVELLKDTDRLQLAKDLSTFANIFVVKPVRQGSSVGVSIVNGSERVISEAEKCLGRFGDCMIEQFIPGREVTVGILDGRTLPIIEIRPKNAFYDYHAKYVDNQTEFLFDTIADADLVRKIEAAAIDCFNALGCRHFARVDFIIADDNVPYPLEVNTIPGLTTHSLLPKAARRAGMDMSRLCANVVEIALKDRRQ